MLPPELKEPYAGSMLPQHTNVNSAIRTIVIFLFIISISADPDLIASIII